jgi:hypothetical protein
MTRYRRMHMSIFEPVKQAEAKVEAKADELVGKAQSSKYTALTLLGLVVLGVVFLLV